MNTAPSELGHAPYASASAATSISAGMRVLMAVPTASIAGYWPTVGPLSGHTGYGAHPPVAELASAMTLVRLAEAHGAAQFAAPELERARGRAQSASDVAQIDPERAKRLAEQANLDAQAALARVYATRARQAALLAASAPSTGLPNGTMPAGSKAPSPQAH